MRVLFVCSGNAHRSPLAEALLKKLRPNWDVDSAGTHVAIPISDAIREYLARESAEEYLKRAPEKTADKKLGEYDIIVAMEKKHKHAILTECPECEARIIVWNVEDPYFMSKEDAKNVYKQIKRKVTELAKLMPGHNKEKER